MNYFKILFLLSCTLAFGQVGIGTDKPDLNTALDVNGKVKLRDLPQTKSNGEQIIVTDSVGNLKISDLAKELLRFKSDLTKASGKLHTDGATNQMKFDKIKSNKGNNYNASKGIFTAPSNGLYFIQVYIYYNYGVSQTLSYEFRTVLKIFHSNTKGSRTIGYNAQSNNVNSGDSEKRTISLSSFFPLKKGENFKVQFFINTKGVSWLDSFTVKKESSLEIYKLL